MLSSNGALCDLLLFALFLAQTIYGSSLPRGTDPDADTVTCINDALGISEIHVADYVVEPTEAKLKRYKESYFSTFRGIPRGKMGFLLDLGIQRNDETVPGGLLLTALKVIHNRIDENEFADRKKSCMELKWYTTCLLYGLDLIGDIKLLGIEQAYLKKHIGFLKTNCEYCPGVLERPFAFSPLLASATYYAIRLFNESVSGDFLERFSEMYPSALRNYPMLFGCFRSLDLVTEEAYSHQNRDFFFLHVDCIKTASSEVLYAVLELYDWELSEEKVKLLVEARGEERLISEICHDCRAWQVMRLMAPKRATAADVDTQDLFFDFNWDLFESCQSFDSVSIENLQCPIQRGAAIVRYIVATERYLHNALVVLHVILERIGTYYGMDETEILESTEHRERLEPYISRVKKIASLRVELKEMFKPEWFDSNFIAPLLKRPLSHRVRMFMKHKGPLCLHLLKESNLQEVYLSGRQLHFSLTESIFSNSVDEAHYLLNAWTSISQELHFEKSHFAVDFMFLLVDGLEEPSDHTSKAKYELLLEKLKASILDSFQDETSATYVNYVDAILPEHSIASELLSVKLCPASVGCYKHAVDSLISLHAEYEKTTSDAYEAAKLQGRMLAAEFIDRFEDIAADVRIIFSEFTIHDVIDCILPQLLDLPNVLEMIVEVKCLLSLDQMSDLIVLTEQQPSPLDAVIDFISSPHGQKILANTGIVFRQRLDQIPVVILKSLALAALSIPGWNGTDVVAVYKACDGIIHNFDPWLTLLQPELWKNGDAVSVIGAEASFLAMLKVPIDCINVYFMIPCTAALWLFDNIERIPPAETYSFVAKWMVRWELNFVQWLVYLKCLPEELIFARQSCIAYHYMHLCEAHARSFMVLALKKRPNDSIAKGLVTQLTTQPASFCRLSYLLKFGESSELLFKREKLTVDEYRKKLESLGDDSSFNGTQGLAEYILKNEASREVFDNATTASLLSTFPKFGKEGTLMPEQAVANHSRTVRNLEHFLTKYIPKEKERILWLARLKICEAVDEDGIISDSEKRNALGEWLEVHRKDLPLNDLAFIELALEQ